MNGLSDAVVIKRDNLFLLLVLRGLAPRPQRPEPVWDGESRDRVEA